MTEFDYSQLKPGVRYYEGVPRKEPPARQTFLLEQAEDGTETRTLIGGLEFLKEGQRFELVPYGVDPETGEADPQGPDPFRGVATCDGWIDHLGRGCIEADPA